MRRAQAALQRWLAWARTTVPVQFAERYAADNLPNWAAAVAYHAFFSLFPILLSLWTIIGVVLQDDARLALVANTLRQFLPGPASTAALDVLQSTRENTGIFGVLSTVGLLYSASALFGSLETAFNSLYRVPSRGFVEQKVMATAMLLLLAVLLLCSVVAASLAEAVEALAEQAATSWLSWLPWQGALLTLSDGVSALGWILPAGWAFFFFLALYAIVPNRRLTLEEVWPGAAAAALLFLAITQVFPIYLRYFARFDHYGAFFAATLLLLTWFYILAHIILLGAALNAYFGGAVPAAASAALRHRRRAVARAADPPPAASAERPPPSEPPTGAAPDEQPRSSPAAG